MGKRSNISRCLQVPERQFDKTQRLQTYRCLQAGYSVVEYFRRRRDPILRDETLLIVVNFKRL